MLILLRIQKNKLKYNFHYVAKSTMASQVLKFVDFTKTWKARYVENEALLFLQIKKFINYTPRTNLWQEIVLQQR